MKSRDRESLRSLSNDELRTEMRQAREKLFRFRFQHGVTPAHNPLEIRQTRRHVARLETLIREKLGANSAEG